MDLTDALIIGDIFTSLCALGSVIAFSISIFADRINSSIVVIKII
jgi:hypothetical protein